MATIGKSCFLSVSVKYHNAPLQSCIAYYIFLQDLPTSIGRLRSMSVFNVDRNRITDIPVEIGKCTRLNVLSLRDNRLLRLPQELGRLEDLHVLDVSGNR